MIKPHEYVRQWLEEGALFEPDEYLRAHKGELSEEESAVIHEAKRILNDAARVQPGEFENIEEWTK